MSELPDKQPTRDTSPKRRKLLEDIAAVAASGAGGTLATNPHTMLAGIALGAVSPFASRLAGAAFDYVNQRKAEKIESLIAETDERMDDTQFQERADQVRDVFAKAVPLAMDADSEAKISMMASIIARSAAITNADIARADAAIALDVVHRLSPAAVLLFSEMAQEERRQGEAHSVKVPVAEEWNGLSAVIVDAGGADLIAEGLVDATESAPQMRAERSRRSAVAIRAHWGGIGAVSFGLSVFGRHLAEWVLYSANTDRET